MGKQRFLKFIKKQWIMIWLIVASVALVTVISFAAYKDANNRIKRVFVASKQIDFLFTSNYLIRESNYNSVSFNEADAKTFGVYIRNYDPSSGGVHEGTITYSLHAELAHKTMVAYNTVTDSAALQSWTSENMSIQISDGTHTITLSGNTLSGDVSSVELPDTDPVTGNGSGKRNTHQWNVTFTNIPLDSDYCVTITATPTDGSGAITSTLGIGSFPDTQNDGWTCMISDDKSKEIINYDAFNYFIAGSGGTTLYFSYDANCLEINPVFCTYHTEATLYESYHGSTTEGRTGWKTLVIAVGTANRYDLQMYKLNPSSQPMWSDLDPANKSWVEFEIEE
ncbi:MAG: hypothetical protein IKO03_01790 [Lachnospiraceae bacterium]|nr:hypothetical protein [Lachnospiraceae bacterium]